MRLYRFGKSIEDEQHHKAFTRNSCIAGLIESGKVRPQLEYVRFQFENERSRREFRKGDRRGEIWYALSLALGRHGILLKDRLLLRS